MTKHIEIYEEKLRYRSLAMMWSKDGRVLCIIEKEKKLSLILISESRKFWVSDSGFLKLAPQSIECSGVRDKLRDKSKYLESPGLEGVNIQILLQKI